MISQKSFWFSHLSGSGAGLKPEPNLEIVTSKNVVTARLKKQNRASAGSFRLNWITIKTEIQCGCEQASVCLWKQLSAL